jgi:hypothetical protein
MVQDSENHYIVDYPISISDDTSYISIPKHRNKGSLYSIWTIHIYEEVQCFIYTHRHNWIAEGNGWGLHLVDGKPEFLGEVSSGKQSKIAKFVVNQAMGLWHGYPSDYQRNKKDRPPISILEVWRDLDLIKKADISKVRGGKSCRL